MTKREMCEAMLAGKTLINNHGIKALFSDATDNFSLLGKDGSISFMGNMDFTGYDWRIKGPKKMRPMTRAEVLGFLANTQGIVVRMDNEDTWEPSLAFVLDFECCPDIEYATITPDGIIGEAHKFEKEVEA